MLTIRGGTRVIADLAEIGYDCEWQIIGADEVGAWHRRKRIWIVAYPRCEHGEGQEVLREHEEQNRQRDAIKSERSTQCDRERIAKRTKDVSNTDHNGNRTQKHRTDKRGKKKAQGSQFKISESWSKSSRHSKDVSNTYNSRHMDRQTEEQPTEGRLDALSKLEPSSTHERDVSEKNILNRTNSTRRNTKKPRGYWIAEPDVGRVANGIPNRVDRLKGLGNAIVPQVAYEIMKRIK